MLVSLLAAALAAPAPLNPLAALASGPSLEPVQLVVVPSSPDQAAALGDRIAAQWDDVRLEVVAGGLIQLSAPPRRLNDLAEMDGVQRLRRPRRATPKGTISEGVDTMFAQDWHALGLDGAGVRVAVLDVGFTGYERLLGAELPDSVETHFLGDPNVTEHGTAVAEIIHDIAPAAELVFYSFETEVEFLSACQQIQDNGEYLVNASIGFDNVWHADGTSQYSQAVDGLADAGVAWLAAAGNESEKYWVGTLTDTDGDNFLEMDGEELIPIYVGDGYSGASIRWDQPFGSASADLDLILYSEDGTELGRSEEEQSGSGDPYEYTWVKSDDKFIYAAIYDYSGSQGASSAGTRAWVYSDWELGDGWPTMTETLTLPADAVGAITVGAVEWRSGEVASYSSRGPTNDGRMKPDISAPTAVSTDSYGPEAFDGTSAATPHAAGLAALLFQAEDQGYTAEQLRSWLRANTVDLGDPGDDNDYGAGLLRADEPPSIPDNTGDTGSTDDTGEYGDSGYADDTGEYGDSGYGEEGGGCSCSAGGLGMAHLGVAWLSFLLAFRRRR